MISNLSIIFPLFNEENRLPRSLLKIIKFLKSEKKRKIEIILVNDGSRDKSLQLINAFKKKNKSKFNIKIVSLPINKGKGFAIYEGIKCAKYEWILTSDIDHSVSLSQLNIWEKKNYILDNNFTYIGSRTHKNSIVNKLLLRSFLGGIFSLIIKLLFKIKLTDTQCGFKLYKKNIAKKCFRNLIRPGYEHDIEVIIKLKKYKIKIIELPVKWTHKKHSKVNIFIDPLKMFLGILILKFYY